MMTPWTHRMLLALLASLAIGCAAQPGDPKTPTTPTTTEPVVTADDATVCGCEMIALPIEADTTTVTAAGRPQLERALACASHPDVTAIMLGGHTATTGTGEYNLSLGERFASAVAGAMTEAGIDEGLIETRSWGEDRPVCTDGSPACQARNRRVEVEVVCGY